MRLAHFGSMDVPTATSLLAAAGFGYSAWLTSIVFCAANDCRPLLVASASFFPVGILHGVGIWFGAW